jgi:hypothetical protein
MDDSMIGTLMNDKISYFILQRELEPIAVVTDTFFQDEKLPCCGLTKRIQVSNLDVQIDGDCLASSRGFVPLDINVLTVNQSLKQFLVELGLDPLLFREMTVNQNKGILFQIVAPSSYSLYSPAYEGVNCCPVCGRTVAHLEANQYYIFPDGNEPIGCIRGREDYQELFVQNELLMKINEFIGYKLPVVPVPLYVMMFQYILEAKLEEYQKIQPSYFKDDSFISALRANDKLRILAYASEIQDVALARLVYDNIRNCVNSSFEHKKKAIQIFKK